MGIELKPFSGKDVDTVFEIQRASYKPLYERYHDTDTNPYLESREKVSRKYTREGTSGYLILEDGTAVGAVRISISGENNSGRISALCVLPCYQGRGTAQKALTEIERLHPGVRNWSLDTILEEAGCCHLYEKM